MDGQLGTLLRPTFANGLCFQIQRAAIAGAADGGNAFRLGGCSLAHGRDRVRFTLAGAGGFGMGG